MNRFAYIDHERTLWLHDTKVMFDFKVGKGKAIALDTGFKKSDHWFTDDYYAFTPTTVMNPEDYINFACKLGAFDNALTALQCVIHHNIDNGKYGKK